MKDFFISYNKAETAWAEWIAWILEEAGYTVVFAPWDFRAGENFVLRMHEAAKNSKQTIAIISNSYLNAEYTHPEWAAAFAHDPKGDSRNLIPIKVSPCELKGLLNQVIYIDLVGRSEESAKEAVLSGLKERAKPSIAPVFPSSDESSRETDRVIRHPVHYPGRVEGSESAPRDVPSNLPASIPLFVGRNDIIDQLKEALSPKDAPVGRMQAISGLGGIGKTQTAIEFARRYRDDYNALLWAVAESSESLRSDFVTIASILNLPEAHVQDQTSALNAVKRWLKTNRGWLLILDNADDVSLVGEFIPQGFNGSILLTSRAQVFDKLGILNPLELQSLSPAEAMDFLVRRTGSTDLDSSESRAAEQLAAELDYLPLALEQAAAYIKQLKGSFPDYLNSYRKRGLELLEKGHASGEYGKSVRTTWSLNFQQVAQSSTASADFLRISAFLSPDRIPTELFTEGAQELGPDIALALKEIETDPLVLDELMRPPVNFSLIHRDRRTRTYDIHRLVQAVLMDMLEESLKLLWANRVVKSLERVLLDVDSSVRSDWPRIERLVPHVQRVAIFAATNLSLDISEAAKLFNRAGRYLHLRGRLSESENLFNEALRILDRSFSANDVDLASCLHNKGWLYHDQAKYDEAESLLLKAFNLRKNALGQNHPDAASSLNWLAVIYEQQGRFQESRQAYQSALAMREPIKGGELAVAESLTGLARLLYEFGDYGEARKLTERAIAIQETSGTEHYSLATTQALLGIIGYREGKLEEAERAFRRSIVGLEKFFGPDYPRLAGPLQGLGVVYLEKGEERLAEDFLTRSIALRESLGLTHPEVAYSLEDLGYLKLQQRKYPEAESIAKRALSIVEQAFEQDHLQLAEALSLLAEIYVAQKQFSKGEPFARRALNIRKNRLGIQASKTSNAMLLYAQILRAMNRKGEAQRLEAQGRKIQSKQKKKKKRLSR